MIILLSDILIELLFDFMLRQVKFALFVCLILLIFERLFKFFHLPDDIELNLDHCNQTLIIWTGHEIEIFEFIYTGDR